VRIQAPIPVYPSSWSVPEVGWIKVNWDAALHQSRNLMGVGLIARDELGCVQATMCYSQKFVMDPIAAEAFGARLAVEFCAFLSYHFISLEGDAQEVVKAMLRDDDSCCSFGSLIHDAKEILKNVDSWDISYVPRLRERGMRMPII
jgi:hypothetical protein